MGLLSPAVLSATAASDSRALAVTIYDDTSSLAIWSTANRPPHRGNGKEGVDALLQDGAYHCTEERAPVSLEPEVSVGPLVFHSVVGLHYGRTCKAQGRHLQPRT